MVRTNTRIVRAPFSTSGHNIGLTSASAGNVNNYVVGTTSTSTAFIPSPAGGRRNNASSAGTYLPVQPQTVGGEESMSLIVQLGTTVVASSSSSQIVSNTMTVAKTTNTVLTSRNFQEQRIVNKVQPSSPVVHRQTNPSTTVSPVSTAHLQLQQQLLTKPSCIVEVQTPKLEGVKNHDAPVTDDSNSDEDDDDEEEDDEDEDIAEEERPTYTGQLAMSYQFALQDHNYGAPPPVSPPQSPVAQHSKANSSINGLSGGNGAGLTSGSGPYSYGGGVSTLRSSAAKKEEEEDEEDANSVISSNPGREVEPEGEETETAPEGEGDDEDSVTRCICVWQHVDCMGIDRNNIPDEYLCERCQPRRVDKQRARTLQLRKREELLNNDTSSDTSSTSSADTDTSIINNPVAVGRKRVIAPGVGRRKNDVNNRKSGTPVTNPVSSLSTVKQRQRRDSTVMQRRGSTNQTRKREPPSKPVEKRVPMRRKSKSRISDDEKEETNPGNAMQQLRQWIDNYEEAVTNHYSPELRARLTSAKANGTHADLKTSSIQNPGNSAAKCRVTQISPGVRILVATSMLSANCPIIEIRGKYMLSGQHKPVSFTGVSTKRSRPPPGPFLFFYRLPKDGTEVCVDARTYGNDARFVRRSCKPNAELKHCIDKGALHLYIVTLSSVDKNEEITVNHYISQELLGPNSTRFNCACGNPKECTAMIRRNGIHEAFDRERRRRGRRTISSEEDFSQTQSSTTNIQTDTPPNTNMPLRRNSSNTRSPVKSQVTPPIPEEPLEKSREADVAETNEKSDKKKMTREERKMEAIMKAFERLEKAEQRRQENQAKQAQRKEHDVPRKETQESKKEAEKDIHLSVPVSKLVLDRPRRRKRKGRRLNSGSQQAQPSMSRRRTRRTSVDSDGTSGEEGLIPGRPAASPSPPAPATATSTSTPAPAPASASAAAHSTSSAISNAASSTSHPAGTQDPCAGNRLQTAAGLLLALSNTQMPNMTQPYQTPRETTPPPTPAVGSTGQARGGVNPTLFSSVCDSGGSGSSSSQGSTPPTPLSAACLMVAAAVGPLAPGFKFPKTKKVLMNEWLNKSPDPPPPVSSPTLPPLLSSLPSNRPEPGEGLDGYSYKSLATLVQAASRVGMSSPTPPGSAVATRTGGAPGAGSAKKRWLRQAISEECDSPNNNSCPSPSSRAGSPPCSDYVTPLKKRRLARESMSSEQSFTPPTTPTMPEHSVSNGSPLHKEVSHYEMAANALGVSCDDDDDGGSPEETGTPRTPDEEEEYEEAELKSSSHELECHRYEDGPTVDELEHSVACAEEPVYGEEDETTMLAVNSECDGHEKVGEEVLICEGEDHAIIDHNVEECANGNLLKSSARFDEDALNSSGASEDRANDSVEGEEVEANALCATFKNPVVEEDSNANFKKPADVDSVEGDVSVRKDSQNQEEICSVQPTKRKLSISEYRQRKQRTNSCSDVAPRAEEGENVASTSPARIRNRSDSTSSSSSSVSSDDARTNKILADTPALATLPLFMNADGPDEKKAGAGEDVNYVRWNSAPTLVERQRENLTERLRREFGLFLSDDEEQERARKQGLSQEGAKDGKSKSPPPPPPPPLPPPLPSPSDANASGSHQHVVGMFAPSPKVGSYSVMGSGTSSSVGFAPSYMTNCNSNAPPQTPSSHTPVMNGPSYGGMYPVAGPMKGQGQAYQSYTGVATKAMNAGKGNKLPLYPPGTVSPVSLPTPPKPFYMPASNTPNNVQYNVPGQYNSGSGGIGQSQAAAVGTQRVVPSGNNGHYVSPAIPPSNALQTSSPSQPPSANPAGSFYTVAAAKAYYQPASRP